MSTTTARLYVGGANGPNLLDPATGRYDLYDNEQHNKSHAQSVFAQAIAEACPATWS